MQPSRPQQSSVSTPQRRGGPALSFAPMSQVASNSVTPRNGIRSVVIVAPTPSTAAQANQQQVANARQTYEALHRVRELVKNVDTTFTELLDQHETQEYSKIEIAQVLADRDKIRVQCGLAPDSGSTAAEGELKIFDGGAGRLVEPPKPHPLIAVDATSTLLRRGDSTDVSGGTTPAGSTANSVAARAAKPPVDLFQVDESATRRALRYRRVVPAGSAMPADEVPIAALPSPRAGREPRPPSDTVSQYHLQLDRLVRDGDDANQRTGDLMMYVASVEELMAKLSEAQEQHVAQQNTSAAKQNQRMLTYGAGSGASTSVFTEGHFKQIRDAVQRLCDAARGAAESVSSTVEQLVSMKDQLEARDVAVGPVQSMLKVTKEELLFARQQRDEAKRELMLHRVCARWRRLVRQGREMRGEEFALICTATQLLGNAPSLQHTGGASAAELAESAAVAASAVTTGAAAVTTTGPSMGDGMGGNISNPHSAVAGLTPALRLQGAAMARNAFRTVPPRKGASAGDVERAETELTHCIANVDVMLATTVHVAIGDYDVLWNRFPYAMKGAVKLFNQVVDLVAARFVDGSALVYRSRGSVAFAPHGGYHLLLFRHPHEAIHFSTMLHIALLLAPWPQQILDIRGGPAGDRRDDVDGVADTSCSAGAGGRTPAMDSTWGETMRMSDTRKDAAPTQPIRYDATALDTSGAAWSSHIHNPPGLVASDVPDSSRQRTDQLRFDERTGFVQGKQSDPNTLCAPGTICGGAGTIIYDPERCVHTVELQRPRVARQVPLGGGGHRSGDKSTPMEESFLATSGGSGVSPTTRVKVQPKSRIDILMKEIEEFQLHRQLLAGGGGGVTGGSSAVSSFAAEYQDALAIAEKLSSRVAIGPARVHALLDEPVLFRGLRAKVGMHTGIVFVEGSVRDSQPPTAEEDLSPDDVAYSFRPAFGRSTVQTGATRNRRGSTMSVASETSGTSGADADRMENDAFFGTANAKVPLVYGAAVMKAALLCGTASGGETVISQQSYRVVSGAVDAWGLFARPVAYPSASALFTTSVPVVNDLRYSLFDADESCFQILPLRLAQRAIFFPEDGASSLYNPNWWLPFNTTDSIGGGHASAQMANIERQLATPSLFGERTGTAQAELLFRRIQQLEHQLGEFKNFAVTATENARRGRRLREQFEQAEMEKHDAPAILHLINTLCHLADVSDGGAGSGGGDAQATPPQFGQAPLRSASAEGDSPSRQRSPSTSPKSAGMLAPSPATARVPSPVAEFRSHPIESLAKLLELLVEQSGSGTTLLASMDTPADAPLRYREVMSPSSPAHEILRVLSVDALTRDDSTFQAVRAAAQWVSGVQQIMLPPFGGVLLPAVLLANPMQRRATTTRTIGFSPPSPREGLLPPQMQSNGAESSPATVAALRRSFVAECAATFVTHSLAHSAGVLLGHVQGGAVEGSERSLRRMVQLLEQQVDALWRTFDGFASNSIQKESPSIFAPPPQASLWSLAGPMGKAPPRSSGSALGSGTPQRLHLHVAAMTASRIVCSFALAQLDTVAATATRQSGGAAGGSGAVHHATVTSWNAYVRQTLWSLGGQCKSSTTGCSAVVDVLHDVLPISPTVWLDKRESLVIHDLGEVLHLMLHSVYHRTHGGGVDAGFDSPDRIRLSPRASTAGLPSEARSPRRAVSPTSSIRNADGGDIPSLIDDKLLEGEARVVAASVASDMRAWPRTHPQSQWERIMECVQLSTTGSSPPGTSSAGGDAHHLGLGAGGASASTPATTHASGGSAKPLPTYVGLTFYCEEPEFPFGQLRDMQQTSDDSLHAAPLVRKAARTVVEQVRALYGAARESCEYFLPSLGFIEGETRPRSGATHTGAVTVPTVTMLFPEVHHEEPEAEALFAAVPATGKGSKHAHHAPPAPHQANAHHHPPPSVVSAHTMSVDELLQRASMRPLSQRGPPQALGVWSTHHVESWSLSIALALSSIHRYKGACGFVTPWTIFVPRGGASAAHQTSSPHHMPMLGGAAYLMEGANFVMWKLLSASRNAGQDSMASSLIMSSSSSGPIQSGGATTPLTHPQVVEWLPPEVLAWASSLSEDGDNTSQYLSSLIASIVSGAPSGTIQRGPFEEGIDAKAMDVWMLGMFLWYVATGGVSPFTAVKGYVPPHVGARNARRASTAASATAGEQAAGPSGPTPPITKRRCEEILSCMHKDDTDHTHHPMTSRTSPTGPPSTASTAGGGGVGFLSSSISLTVPGVGLSGRQASFTSISASFQANETLQRHVSRMEPRGVSNVSPPIGAALGDPSMSTFQRAAAAAAGGHRKSLLRTTALQHGIGTSNLFGSIGCLVRNLRICLETKGARRLAPYRASLLFPAGLESSFMSSSGAFTSSGILDDVTASLHGQGNTTSPQQPSASASEGLAAKLHCTSFVLLCDLLHGMLQVNPAHRLSMQEVLRHPYFAQVPTRVASDGKVNVGLPEFVGVEQGDAESGSPRASHATSPSHTAQKKSFKSVDASMMSDIFGGGSARDAPAAAAASSNHVTATSSLLSAGVAAPRVVMSTIPSHTLGDGAAASPTADDELNATSTLWEPPSAFTEFIVQEGPLFQVLPASFSLGVPFLPSAVPATSTTTGQLDVMLDGNGIEWNTAQLTLTTGHAAPALPTDAVMGALMELKHRRGTALLPVAHDAVIAARQHAACATARRHGLTDDGTHQAIGFPVASEFGPGVLRLLGLPQVTKAGTK